MHLPRPNDNFRGGGGGGRGRQGPEIPSLLVEYHTRGRAAAESIGGAAGRGVRVSRSVYRLRRVDSVIFTGSASAAPAVNGNGSVRKDGIRAPGEKPGRSEATARVSARFAAAGRRG